MNDTNSDTDRVSDDAGTEDIQRTCIERLLLEALPSGENTQGFRASHRRVEGLTVLGLRASTATLRDDDVEISIVGADGAGPMAAIVRFPRAWSQTAGFEPDACVRLPNSAELAFLGAYLAFLTAPGREIPPSLVLGLARHITDLALHCWIFPEEIAGAESGGGVKAARLASVKADIRANIANGALSLEDVARRQGISPRYLRSLFLHERTSFTDFVLEQRLANAFRALSGTAAPPRPITEIAYASGFNDLSYFNRVFKRRYGMTPREARKGRKSEG